jgi:hypothetical protein
MALLWSESPDDNHCGFSGFDPKSLAELRDLVLVHTAQRRYPAIGHPQRIERYSILGLCSQSSSLRDRHHEVGSSSGEHAQQSLSSTCMHVLTMEDASDTRK